VRVRLGRHSEELCGFLSFSIRRKRRSYLLELEVGVPRIRNEELGEGFGLYVVGSTFWLGGS